MADFLHQDIKFLGGVGPKRAQLLASELNIHSMEDLIYYFPFKYVDRTKFYKVKEVHGDLPYIQIRGQIAGFKIAGGGSAKRLIADFTDDTGVIELLWFKGLKWIQKSLKPGKKYILFGKPSVFNNKVNIIHPEMEVAEKFESTHFSALQAFYNTTEKLKNNYITSRVVQKLQANLIPIIKGKISETLPEYLMHELNLLPLEESLINIHFPQNPELLKKARSRLKFEELFFIQLNLLKQKNFRKARIQGHKFSRVSDYFNNFYRKNLSFGLTDAQKRVLKEIRGDVGSGRQMNRLLQGDVGSGKTLVALMTMLIALDNQYQSCLMAPTEILANQHFQTVLEFLKNLSIRVALLTGSTKQADRKVIHEQLKSGELQILIGTHALIEETVIFKNLGMVIIDEQHRFGVAQRAKLWKKNPQPPHVLVMTATPIPRTLAMTLYGDLEISVIDELPPGRKPVKTAHYYDSKRLRLQGFLKKQISEGRQVYIVYPLIKESEKMDYKDLEDGYESVSRDFPAPQYAVSIVHGRMKPEEKEIAMNYFISGKTHIMVSTTVIEVGVDIPNATVMVIESAERFGLSQLHQLRGRVGRGSDQSYCVLMTSFKLTSDAKKRIETMVTTTDGFEIAEIDLKLRGPGDIEGTQQSGIAFDLKIANLGQDGQILQYARDVAERILEDDTLLTKAKNQSLVKQIQKLTKRKFDWSAIS